MHLIGKGSAADKKIFDIIHENGWDEAQFNHEAAKVLESKLGHGWDKFMAVSMAMFGATEKVNRATTIFAAYKGIMATNDLISHEEALEKAKEVSDKAHGIYGKATLPYMVQGKGPGQMAAKSAYTFAKFSHNYILTMIDLGYDKKAYGSMLHMLLAPVFLGGVGSSVLTPFIAALAKAVGGGDDPEEELYAWADETFGGGDWLRSGAFGLGGEGGNLEGSLGINLLSFPTTLKELLGAPFSVMADEVEAVALATRGEGKKALEKALPAGLGNIVKGYREQHEGVTTKTGAPLFWGNRPLKGTVTDTVLRFFSFNPARMAKIKDIQWSEKSVAADYSDARQEIYDRCRKFLMVPRAERKDADRVEIVAMAMEYNQRVRSSGRLNIPRITRKSVAVNMKRTFRPSKVERIRAALEFLPIKTVNMYSGNELTASFASTVVLSSGKSDEQEF